MPPDVSIVEEHKRDISEAKQLARKLVMPVLPTDKNEDKDKDKDKEDEKNDKVLLHSQNWLNGDISKFYFIAFFLVFSSLENDVYKG